MSGGRTISGGRTSSRTRTIRGGTDPRTTSIYHTTKITTEQNKDPTYIESGIVHLSDSKAINLVRGVITEVTNIFGAKGISNVIYDELRNTTLRELHKLLKPDEKICNLRLEFTHSTPELIFHHAYGTLYRKRPLHVVKKNR
jgi:hypothetical protein